MVKNICFKRSQVESKVCKLLDFSSQIYEIDVYTSYNYVNFSSEIHQTKIISKFNDYINIGIDQLLVLVGKYTRSVTSELNTL